MLLMLVLACATAREERQNARADRQQTRNLSEATELYWRALRWNDLGVCAGFLQDPVYRTDWLTTEAGSDWRYRDAAVLRIELGEHPDEGERREATVIVRVEGYASTNQIMEAQVLTQDWYLDDRSWWVEPGQERGVAH